MVGRTISHYEILEKVGEGGMGVVYKALDGRLDRLVALKVLPPQKVADSDRKRRFVQEAKAASALNHPNIITIYDIGSADGIDFIAMEFVAGKTLDRCIPRHGWRLDEALKYSVQIADALVAAHKAGIVHRDLKPGNVMVTEHGLVKVLDFGLAKLTESTAPADEATTRMLKPTTEEGAIVGTVSYMSPEQAEGKKVDARSDIFSFGAVLYEMVTGRRAFQGDSRLATLTAILHGEPTFSPDGNQVAFTWFGETRDNEDIYVKLIGTTGSPLRLTTDAAKDYSPAWSPDGRFIAFLRNLPRGKCAVLLIPALGGRERKLAEISNLRLAFLPGPYLAWSPDGNSLVIGDRDSLTEPFALFLLSIETGEKRKLTSPPAQLSGDSSPAFSPEGRTLAFSRNTDSGLGDLYLLAFSEGLKSAGEARRISFENRGAATPAWTADGRETVFSDFRGLWRIVVPEFTGQAVKPQRLATLGENVVDPAISRRGQRLAYTHVIFHSNIWRMAAPILDGRPSSGDRESLKLVKNAAPLISSTRADSAPQFSPDGKRIAFMSNRSGNME